MKKILLIQILLLITSCVPYKDIVYVQGEMALDTSNQLEYKVKQGDILYIEIKSGDELVKKFFTPSNVSNNGQINSSSLYFDGYTVDKNGEIELPLLSKIKVEGKTFTEIKKIIERKLLETQFSSLRNVFIKVSLAGVPYTILGEVKNPQTGVLFKVHPNILDAVANSGDVTLTADLRHVTVIRNENGIQIKKMLDLTQSEVVNSPYFYIRPNDMIYIRPLRQKTLGTGTTLTQTISTTITALSLITTIILLSNIK